jgi:hypothetical protein
LKRLSMAAPEALACCATAAALALPELPPGLGSSSSESGWGEEEEEEEEALLPGAATLRQRLQASAAQPEQLRSCQWAGAPAPPGPPGLQPHRAQSCLPEPPAAAAACLGLPKLSSLPARALAPRAGAGAGALRLAASEPLAPRAACCAAGLAGGSQR